MLGEREKGKLAGVVLTENAPRVFHTVDSGKTLAVHTRR
jgi:hypothetical protein